MEDIVAKFRADIEGYKKDVNEAVDATGKFDKKVEDSTKKAKKGFDDAGKSAKGLGKNIGDDLANKFQTLGNRIIAAFAIERVISFGNACIKSFREAEKSANQLNFAVKNIGKEGADAFNRLIAQAKEFQKISIFSDEQIQNAQTQLVQLGLTTDQTEKLIPKIIDLASAQGIDLAQATDKVIQGINGQTRSLKDAGIAFNDTGSKTKNLAILSEGLAKFQGAAAVALDSAAGSAKNLENQIDDLQESIGEKLSPVLQGITLELFEMIAGFVGAETSVDKFINKFNSKEGRIASFTETYKKLTDAQLEAQRKFVLNDILLEGKKGNTEETRKRILAAGDELRAIQNIQAERAKKEQIIRDDLTQKGQADAAQAVANSKKAQEDAQKEALKSLREFQEERNQINIDAAEERLLQIRKEGEVAREELEKQQQKDLELLRKQAEVAREELEQKEKKKRLDRIEQEKQMLDTLFKAQEDAFNRNKELQDTAIEDQKKNIDTQRNLAARGLDNTLIEEERRLAERKRMQEKEAQVQKRVKLLETFLNSLASFSKEDPKTALSKALLQVALATAASAVFAEEGGVIGEIGARSNLRRRHKGGGDILLHAQKGEGIIPVDSMKAIGRRNFELLKNAGRFPIRDNIFAMPKQNNLIGVAVMDNSDVIKELKHLQNVVKNKKENSYTMDEFGNYINTQIENGFKTITMGKLPKIRFNGRS